MKFRIHRVKRKTKKRYYVDFRRTVNGKEVGEGRKFYASREEAALAGEERAKQVSKFGFTGTLSDDDHRTALQVMDRAAKLGTTVDEALAFFKQHNQGLQPQTVTDAAICFLDAKSKAVEGLRGRRMSPRTLEWYTWVVEGFYGVHGHKMVGDLTVKHIESYVDAKGYDPITRFSILKVLRGLLNFCIKRRWLIRNVILEMELVAPELSPPKVLPVSDCRALLARCLATDKPLLPFAALQMFGGLRASEAERVMVLGLQSFIKDGCLDLWPIHTKGRLRRILELDPLDVDGKPFSPLAKWLKFADEKDTLTKDRLARRWRKLRFENRKPLFAWANDCLRHTASSMLYVKMGSTKAALYCGHSEAIQEAHYRARFQREEVTEFWSLTP